MPISVALGALVDAQGFLFTATLEPVLLGNGILFGKADFAASANHSSLDKLISHGIDF